MSDFADILSEVRFNGDGLVPVIVQEVMSNEVLMMAWMNAEALEESLDCGWMCFYSRSRGRLWRKGESSGQKQLLKEMIIDCDGDTLLAKVEQEGVACHTGRMNCFFRTINGNKIVINQDVIIPPEELYDNE